MPGRPFLNIRSRSPKVGLSLHGAFLKGEGDLVLASIRHRFTIFFLNKKTIMWQRNLQRVAYYKLKWQPKWLTAIMPVLMNFLGFLLSPQAQADIAKNNVMLPVVETNIESHIDALNSRAKSMRILDTTTVTSEQLKGWINQWQKALSK